MPSLLPPLNGEISCASSSVANISVIPLVFRCRIGMNGHFRACDVFITGYHCKIQRPIIVVDLFLFGLGLYLWDSGDIFMLRLSVFSDGIHKEIIQKPDKRLQCKLNLTGFLHFEISYKDYRQNCQYSHYDPRNDYRFINRDAA